MAALGFAMLFAGAAVLRRVPGIFDYPVARALGWADSGNLAGHLAAGASFSAVQGVFLVSLGWGCWFSRTGPQARERLIRGAISAVLAGLIAHALHDWLPPAERPVFDPNVRIGASGLLGGQEILPLQADSYGSSFPGERAAMFAGLAISVFSTCRGVGLIALAGTATIEVCHIYLGLHYASDILGSFALAGATKYFLECGPLQKVRLPWCKLEKSWTSAFYGVAFVLSYCVATAFADLRELAAALVR